MTSGQTFDHVSTFIHQSGWRPTNLSIPIGVWKGFNNFHRLIFSHVPSSSSEKSASTVWDGWVFLHFSISSDQCVLRIMWAACRRRITEFHLPKSKESNLPDRTWSPQKRGLVFWIQTFLLIAESHLFHLSGSVVVGIQCQEILLPFAHLTVHPTTQQDWTIFVEICEETREDISKHMVPVVFLPTKEALNWVVPWYDAVTMVTNYSEMMYPAQGSSNNLQYTFSSIIFFLCAGRGKYFGILLVYLFEQEAISSHSASAFLPIRSKSDSFLFPWWVILMSLHQFLSDTSLFLCPARCDAYCWEHGACCGGCEAKSLTGLL